MGPKTDRHGDGLHPTLCVRVLSRVQLFWTPCAVACQALLSMGFPRQEYWSGLPYPSPGDLLDSRVKPESPASQADSLLAEPLGNLTLG